MAEIEFNEDQTALPTPTSTSNGFADMLQKWGLVRSAEQARWALVAIIGICVILIVIIWLSSSPKSGPRVPTVPNSQPI